MNNNHHNVQHWRLMLRIFWAVSAVMTMMPKMAFDEPQCNVKGNKLKAIAIHTFVTLRGGQQAT